MGVQLLDKTRKINKLLHNNNSSKVVFNDICQVLTGVLDSDILVISKKGKVLGSSICKGVDELHELIVDFLFSSSFSSFTDLIISSPTTVVPYSVRMISSMSYSLSLLYSKRVPSLSPAISIGVIIALYILVSSPKPSVSRFTFSFVESRLSVRLSIHFLILSLRLFFTSLMSLTAMRVYLLPAE